MPAAKRFFSAEDLYRIDLLRAALLAGWTARYPPTPVSGSEDRNEIQQPLGCSNW
ncbi:MAG TPA: hypothetical protein VF359_08645 [Anaerolineales bacterium]